MYRCKDVWEMHVLNFLYLFEKNMNEMKVEFQRLQENIAFCYHHYSKR